MSQNGQTLLQEWGRMNPKLATELASCLLDNASLPLMSEFDDSSDMEDEDQSDLPSGIDLHLECEDDKSYDIPATDSGLRLQSNNVCMRISFSQAVESFTCQYCKVNFLSETHLAQHMFSSHYTNRKPRGREQEMESDDDDDDEEDEEEEEEESVEMKPSNGHSNGVGALLGINVSALHGNGVGALHGSGVLHTAPVPELTPPRTPVLFAKKAKMTKTKRKKATTHGKDATGRPPIVLTIKKSRSDPGIQQLQQPIKTETVSNGIHSAGPATPPHSLVSGKSEASSDSTSEMVDVEASSPGSNSPASIKSRPVVSSFTSVKKRGSGSVFPCHICGKTYVSKYALKRHIATHSDARPFICSFPDCKGAFKLKSRLTDHVRYVHKQRTQRTAGRSKSMPVTSTPTLAQALLSPSSLGTSTTATTNSTTVTQSNGVTVANSKAPDPKPFKCTWLNCAREFRDSHNLRMHMCLHTGEMPLRCSHCKYSCIQKAALDIHMKTKHPEVL
jgi:hypothetical protein